MFDPTVHGSLDPDRSLLLKCFWVRLFFWSSIADLCLFWSLLIENRNPAWFEGAGLPFLDPASSLERHQSPGLLLRCLWMSFLQEIGYAGSISGFYPCSGASIDLLGHLGQDLELEGQVAADPRVHLDGASGLRHAVIHVRPEFNCILQSVHFCNDR